MSHGTGITLPARASHASVGLTLNRNDKMDEELGDWLANPQPATFPYDAVIDEYRRGGKHFVRADALAALASARHTLACGADGTLQRFLDVALDKHDGRYEYPTYTGLSLLPIPTLDDHADDALASRDRLVALLVADTLGFELAALGGWTALLPEMRPDPRNVQKRCRHGLRVALPALERLGLGGAVTADEPELAATQLSMLMRRESTPDERRALMLSMLPVYVCHDEYLFIRVLQLFETTFAMLARDLRDAAWALLDGDGASATLRVARAEATLHESAPLFSLLGTMQVESFRTFREYTDGASAIQSRNYKMMESLCRRPDAERLDSAAYTSTPEVRRRVLDGQATLDDAFGLACQACWLSSSDREELEDAMVAFSDTLRRWRQTHYSLAVRMLGEDLTGTGHTAGTPYLKAVRTIEVFRSTPIVREGVRDAV